MTYDHDRVLEPGKYEFEITIAYLNDLHPTYGTPMQRGTTGRIELTEALPVKDVYTFLANEASSDHFGEEVEITRFEINPERTPDVPHGK